MNLSIIIPAYNEVEIICKLVNFLKQHSNNDFTEIIVSDGGSTDNTCHEAEKAGATVIVSEKKGRAAQMNCGAAIAKGDVLYFVHADCLPPPTFVNDISEAIQDGIDAGRYKTKFDSNKIILKLNAWFTRFDLFICMGGDQTLFVTNTLFKKYKGFKESMQIMEEYEFCERFRRTCKYKILNGVALVSARKYETNNWLKVQLANSAIIKMYRKGATQKAMVDRYKKMLRYH